MITIAELTSMEELDKLLSESSGTDEIVFLKYSPVCTISFVAVSIFNRWVNITKSDKNINIFKINVIASRDVSNKIAEIYEIRHESPQMIWLKNDGSVKWNGSHHLITEQTLNKLLDE
ncbi:MAG: bacillithiol system redox-active protein YtxJ [Bacteroidetes bacterium]|nr:bacillithiol system redox-active protein YtxJ [Bacteroidota bacterium]